MDLSRLPENCRDIESQAFVDALFALYGELYEGTEDSWHDLVTVIMHTIKAKRAKPDRAQRTDRVFLPSANQALADLEQSTGKPVLIKEDQDLKVLATIHRVEAGESWPRRSETNNENFLPA